MRALVVSTSSKNGRLAAVPGSVFSIARYHSYYCCSSYVLAARAPKKCKKGTRVGESFYCIQVGTVPEGMYHTGSILWYCMTCMMTRHTAVTVRENSIRVALSQQRQQ